MIRLALRSMAARKRRTALTAMAIVLGVGLISGTYILTDTIDRAFQGVFSTAYAGVDVHVSPQQDKAFRDQSEPSPFPEALVAKVQAVPGVQKAQAGVFALATIFDKKGKKITKAGPPNFAASVQGKPFTPFEYTQGRPPRTAAEVALDSKAASDAGYHLGDTVKVAGKGPVGRYRLVGVAKYGDIGSLAGAAVAILTLPEAQRITDRAGRIDAIDVQAAPGTDPEVLAGRVRAALGGAPVDVRTGAQEAKKSSDDLHDSFGFLRTILLVFGGVSLFVGAFMIFNTFAITIAQRTREFATLRTLGASARQVLWTVLFEALLFGAIATVVGIAFGMLIAPGLQGAFKAIGADLPHTTTVVKSRTIVVSALVGVLVTLAATLGPAFRATRVSPMAGLREGSVLPPGRLAGLRTPIAAVLGVLGIGLFLYGLFGGTDSAGSVAAILGFGAVAVIFAAALESRRLVTPLARAFGVVLERRGNVAGRLARENAERNPGRTASTAAALMIGVAVVAFVTVFAAGTRHSIDSAIKDDFKGQFVLQNEDGFSAIPIAAAQAAKAVPGVQTVSPLALGQGLRHGKDSADDITGVDPRTLLSVLHINWKDGSDASLARLEHGGAVVATDWAKSAGVGVGDRITFRTPAHKTVSYRIAGTFKPNLLFSGPNVAITSLVRDYDVRDLGVGLVRTKPGADVEQIQTQLVNLMHRDFPSVQALDRTEFVDKAGEQINQLLMLIYVLLSLSVIVSILGIVSTLSLSIHERTREFGMLRAIGTGRKQVRRIVRGESIITALIGAVIGIVLGTFFAMLITQPLKDQGFVLAIPVGQLLVILVLAALAGVLAAVGPARRASKIDVLRAIAYE